MPKRSTVHEIYNGRCYYCTDYVPVADCTIDHFFPLCNGGKAGLSNCVLACAPCNHIKSDFDPRILGITHRHPTHVTQTVQLMMLRLAIVEARLGLLVLMGECNDKLMI